MFAYCTGQTLTLNLEHKLMLIGKYREAGMDMKKETIIQSFIPAIIHHL